MFNKPQKKLRWIKLTLQHRTQWFQRNDSDQERWNLEIDEKKQKIILLEKSRKTRTQR